MESQAETQLVFQAETQDKNFSIELGPREPNGQGQEKKACQCHIHVTKGQKEIEFLSKRIDSKQRLRGYVNLRGMDVPVPWLIWDEEDPTTCCD